MRGGTGMVGDAALAVAMADGLRARGGNGSLP